MEFQEIEARNVSPRTVVGYQQRWYCGSSVNVPRAENWIQTEEKTAEQASIAPMFKAISIARKGGYLGQWEGSNHLTSEDRRRDDYKWKPMIGPFFTDMYLLGKSLVVVNTRKRFKDPKKEQMNQNSFPKYIISILSQTKEGIKESAEICHLPLEEIVNA